MARQVRAPGGAGVTAPAATAERDSGDLRTLARGGALNLLGGGAAATLAFVLVVVVTRNLGAGGAGVFFEAVAIFMILASVCELGASTSMVRTVSRDRALGWSHDVVQTLGFSMIPVLALSGAVATALFLGAPRLAEALGHGRSGDAVAYVRAMAPLLPLAAGTSVLLAGTRGLGTMSPFVLLENVAKPLLRPVLIIAALALGLGPTALALGWALPIALVFPLALIAFVVLLRRLQHRPEAEPEPTTSLGTRARAFWAFALPRGVATASQVSVLWLAVPLVGALSSARDAGIYAAVSRTVILGTLAIEAVRLAIAPQLSGLLARKDYARAEQLYQSGTWWLMALSWPLYAALGVFAPLLLQIFGGQFVAGADALLILSIAMLLNTGTGSVTVVLLMGGKSLWNLFNTLGALAITVVLSIVLIPRFGVTGAAMAWATSMVFENVAALVEIRLLFGLQPFGSGYPRVAFAGLACFGGGGLAARALLGPTLPALVVATVVATVAYAALLWRWRHILQLPTLLEGIRSWRRARPQAAAVAEPAPEATG
ncbi:MAG: oligosaccharide flippase family protein [Actinomycetota bacterium]|nr:oligosaccharide flippase family protein [Actinomycetota bacterium]